MTEGRRPPPPAVALFGSAQVEACRQRALVLAALDIPHEELASPGWHALAVPAEHAARAAEELDRWERENRPQPAPPAAPDRPGARAAALAWVAVLTAVFLVSLASRGGVARRGTAVAEAILSGQAWLAVTALTVHADAAHLVANLVFGALFVAVLARRWGAGLALATTLAAGSLGNLANAFVQGAGHRSLGASTAVFAALGLAAASLVRQRGRAGEGRLRRWAPAVAALLLLAYLGFEGVRTDVSAHVCGFLAGALIGACSQSWLDGAAGHASRRRLSAGVAACVLAAAWWLALSS